MESWCFDSLDKGFVSTDILSTSNSIDRFRGEFNEWESKPSFSYENIGSFPSQQVVENPSFPDMGIAEIMYDYASLGDFVSPGLVTSNDEDSSSKVSSTVIDSNSQESSLIKLKMDGYGNKPDSNSTRTAHVLSSEESSTPPKRARTTSSSSQTVYCQVYGCLKDLSSAKDYHKRHKVCDVHSKTSEVIVNGVEQRFCQQCSRFHLLGEFDGTKRSCRKRLAGHNERRRKPQVAITSKCGTSLRSYTGSNFQRFNPRSTSSICQDMLPKGTAHLEKLESSDLVRRIKIEGKTICTEKPAYNPFNEHLRPKSTSFPSTFEKQFPSINNTNQNYSNPRSILEEKLDPFTPKLVSQFMFQTSSLGAEDLALLDEASTIKGLSGISESNRALSLLSSKSRVSSIPSNDPSYSVNEVSENGYPLYMSNHTGESLTHQSSKFINIRNGLLCEDRDTIDLVSYHLSFQEWKIKSNLKSLSRKKL